MVWAGPRALRPKWPRAGLGLVNLASQMCYPMQNNLDLIVSISWLYHYNIHDKTWLSTLMWD